MNKLPSTFSLSAEVSRALDFGMPIVALESTVITHGLPRPDNQALAEDMERAVRNEGAVPATIALLEGKVHVGLSLAEMEQLSMMSDVFKVSRRDFAKVIVKKANGGTTVAGTMFAAHKAGISVFATGGIGGVHREARFDVSTDLQALADTPMIVVCAGAKSILDLPSTLEYLETMSVPVVGWQTDEFPAFFSRSAGLPVSFRIDKEDDLVDFAHTHWGLGFNSAVLVCQPIPEASAIPIDEIEAIEQQASDEAVRHGKRGQELTPFLLQRVNELSNGRSLKANIDLLLNNASLAAKISKAMTSLRKQQI